MSQLAKRHGIHVRLQTNIYGGVQAVLVVPQALLGTEPEGRGGVARVSEPQGSHTPAGGPAVPPQGRAQQAPVPRQQRHTASSTPTGGDRGAGETTPGTPRQPQPQPQPQAGRGAAPRADGSGPAPLPVRGAHEERANPAEAVPGIKPAERRFLDENTVAPPTPRISTVRGTMDKPQLPRRRAQEHIAPQLREAPAPRQEPDHLAGHDPGLMAAFQRGIGLAETQQQMEASQMEAAHMDAGHMDVGPMATSHMETPHMDAGHSDTGSRAAAPMDTEHTGGRHMGSGHMGDAASESEFKAPWRTDPGHMDLGHGDPGRGGHMGASHMDVPHTPSGRTTHMASDRMVSDQMVSGDTSSGHTSSGHTASHLVGLGHLDTGHPDSPHTTAGAATTPTPTHQALLTHQADPTYPSPRHTTSDTVSPTPEPTRQDPTSFEPLRLEPLHQTPVRPEPVSPDTGRPQTDYLRPTSLDGLHTDVTPTTTGSHRSHMGGSPMDRPHITETHPGFAPGADHTTRHDGSAPAG